MRYHALVCDYDGTLAFGGRMKKEVAEALGRVRASGRKLILVTGRELEDLLLVCPEIDLFDGVVAENGAVLFWPTDRKEILLCEKPPDKLIQALRDRGIEPLSTGRIIIDTRQPNESAVLETIRDLGLEFQLIFNKGAVMVLPPGINKATGLHAVLNQLGLSPHNAVGIGDGENDHAFLDLCECSLAVANSLPMIKEKADFIPTGENGQGVIEIIDLLLASDLHELGSRLRRHEILIGSREGGVEVRLKSYAENVLVLGSPGSGKSTFATAFMEQLTEKRYQFCIVDPEGDYGNLENTVLLGSNQSPPILDEIVRILERPDQNPVVNLLAVPLQDRPQFFQSFLPRIHELRARTGRPHWVLLDEAHHMLPASKDVSPALLQKGSHNHMIITVHPKHVTSEVLSAADVVIAIAGDPQGLFRDFTETLGHGIPKPALPSSMGPGEAVVWFRRKGEGPFRFRSIQSRTTRQRHLRKYAEGTLSPERSFYFQGPDGKLNLRARNLFTFIQLAEGIDDETWRYHLKNGDVSGWFRKSIKDEGLASAAEIIEKMDTPPEESRRLIKKAIEERYTLPS